MPNATPPLPTLTPEEAEAGIAKRRVYQVPGYEFEGMTKEEFERQQASLPKPVSERSIDELVAEISPVVNPIPDVLRRLLAEHRALAARLDALERRIAASPLLSQLLDDAD